MLRWQPGDYSYYWKYVATDREVRRAWKAMELSPTLDICRALLSGERVPVEMLNQEAVRRYGMR